MEEYFLPTQYGFEWKNFSLVRAISDDQAGCYMEIRTKRGRYVIRVTPAGFVYANKMKNNQPNQVWANSKVK